MKSNILEYFLSLVKIDSESKNEKEIAYKLKKDIKRLGGKTYFDNAYKKTGGNIGNLYGYFKGSIDKEPILLCAHMDTVKPGNNIQPQLEAGKVKSDGTTILGADDKSGLAQIIAAIKSIKANNIKHAPIEVIFTISEEIGLLGAKNVELDRINSKMGIAFDGHEVGKLMNGAPSQNTLDIRIFGKEAHAGMAPEKGINAIKVAADAITKMPSGRIDKETTCNLGIISGGKATNIVPGEVKIKAEVRSHSEKKLKQITDQMLDTVNATIQTYKDKSIAAKCSYEVINDYQSFFLEKDTKLIKLAEKTSEKVGLEFDTIIIGGGSDVNIFNRNGIEMAIAGTGMRNVHTKEEYIKIKDLEAGAKWIEEFIKLYSRGQ